MYYRRDIFLSIVYLIHHYVSPYERVIRLNCIRFKICQQSAARFKQTIHSNDSFCPVDFPRSFQVVFARLPFRMIKSS